MYHDNLQVKNCSKPRAGYISKYVLGLFQDLPTTNAFSALFVWGFFIIIFVLFRGLFGFFCVCRVLRMSCLDYNVEVIIKYMLYHRSIESPN